MRPLSICVCLSAGYIEGTDIPPPTNSILHDKNNLDLIHLSVSSDVYDAVNERHTAPHGAEHTHREPLGSLSSNHSTGIYSKVQRHSGERTSLRSHGSRERWPHPSKYSHQTNITSKNNIYFLFLWMIIVVSVSARLALSLC